MLRMDLPPTAPAAEPPLDVDSRLRLDKDTRARKLSVGETVPQAGAQTDLARQPLCAHIDRFSLHAAVQVETPRSQATGATVPLRHAAGAG